MNDKTAPSLVELGQRLREARMRRGWTLEQVFDRTRIQLRYLEAIEAGNYSSLPATVYIRGFVRTYAKLLDLDEETHLQALDKAGLVSATAFGKEGLERLARTTPEKSFLSLGWLRSLTPYWVLVMAVGFVGVLAGGLAIKGISSLVAKREGRAIPPSPLLAEKAAPEPQKKRTRPKPGRVLSRIAVSVTAHEDCWVEYQLDSRNPRDVVIKAGESRVWFGDGRVRLLLGNAGGVSVSGPKGPVSLPAGPRRVVHLLFTSGGLEKLQVPGAASTTTMQVSVPDIGVTKFIPAAVSATQVGSPAIGTTQISSPQVGSTTTSP